MSTFWRTTVLGFFVAIGAGAAVTVALQSTTVNRPVVEKPSPTLAVAMTTVVEPTSSEPAAIEHDTPDRSNQVRWPDISPTPSISLMENPLREGLDQNIFPDQKPEPASIHPQVSKQFELLEQALQGIQKNQQDTADAVDKLRLQAPTLNSAPETAATPVPIGPSAPNASSALPSPVYNLPDVRKDDDTDTLEINASRSDIREVLKLLAAAGGVNLLTSPLVTGEVSLRLKNVDVDAALNAVAKASGLVVRREGRFVFVSTLEESQNLAVTDQPLGTRIYRPNYVTSTEFQKLVTPILTKGIGFVSMSTASEVGIAASADTAGGDGFAGTEAIIVRDYESVLVQIDEIFRELDRTPRQVAIEATIISVRLDDDNTLGIDFELLRQKNQIRVTSGTPVTNLATANFTDGLKIGFLDSSMFAFLNALETIGDTHVVASPRVMCLNKQRAEILIGSELGYVNTTVTQTAATQTVEFLEVGTNLKIRPFISSDGMVRMEVHPELSTGTVRVQGGFTLPDKEVTQVTTNIMCRSGATVVLGGLIREDLVVTSEQIPILGNLPWVGPVFRRRSEGTERRELLVLITPRVLSEEDMYTEADHAAQQFKDRRNVIFDKMSPIAKRSVGERYGRLAVSAWVAGDPRTALGYANLALHYDPLHQAAVDLRKEILTAYPGLEPRVLDQLRTGLGLLDGPHGDYSAEAGWPWRDSTEPNAGRIMEVPQPESSSGSGTIRSVRRYSVSDSTR